MTTLNLLATALAPLGLQVLGHCATQADDQLPSDSTIILIGPDEPNFWPIFTQSAEYSDGTPDPMDRWSRRVLSDLAPLFDAQALFPFGGAPFLPFFTWAQRTGRFWPSPINFLVHDTAGLFVSFRGALVIPQIIPATAAKRPCDTCDAPCAQACPVDAFAHGYDVPACKDHLASPEGVGCMTTGCRARRACPINQGHRAPQQAAFHMKAFL